MRRDAREAVFKILYAKSFNDENGEDFFNEIFAEHKLTKEDKSFADDLLRVIEENGEFINSKISELSVGYSFERLFPADKCALTLAIAEMTYFDDIPDVVSIDEAVSLSKKYSEKESPNFVNGILAKYKSQRG